MKIVLVCLFFSVVLLRSQEAPVAKPVIGRVEGKVINSANGDLVRKATVTLVSRSGPKGPVYFVETDGNGVFRIDNVEPGEYSIDVDRQGFMVKLPGATGAPLPPVKVERDQTTAELKIPVVPLGVITGRVTYEDGDPARGAQVQAMQYAIVSGKKQLNNVAFVNANEKGEFRLFGLRPGSFVLQAKTRYGNSQIFAPGLQQATKADGPATTFYPSTTDPGRALPVEIAAGSFLRGMDIRLRHETLYRVHGQFPPEQGAQNSGNYMVQLARRDGDRSGNFGSRRTNQTFEFAAVQSGAYVILGTRLDGDRRSYAYQPVDVGTEEVDVGTLAFSPGAEMSGTVQVEGPNKISLANLRLSLQAETPSMFGFPGAEVKADGTFVLKDIAPAVYRVAIGAPGAYLKAVRLGDQEIPNSRIDMTRSSGPLTVILGSDMAQVEGDVHKANGDPAPRVRVTLIPQGEHTEYSRVGFTDEKGHYIIRNVAPGDFKIFAFEDVPVGKPQDPEFRKPFEKRGVPLKLEPSAHAKADAVTMISVADLQHPEQ